MRGKRAPLATTIGLLVVLLVFALSCAAPGREALVRPPAPAGPRPSAADASGPAAASTGRLQPVSLTQNNVPAAAALPAAAPARAEPHTQPTGVAVLSATRATVTSAVAAIHRSGQTFITWPERAGLSGERYRVYRSSSAITPTNLLQATLLYTVPKGSAVFYANRYCDGPDKTACSWPNRYLARYVIPGSNAELSNGTGLLVWTLAPEDFAGASQGQGYYAVTVLPVDGGETWLGATAAPLREAVTDPLPVEVAHDVGPGGRLYIQYMDLRHWNPTFDAPNPLNAYYGENPQDPQVALALQYAYDYTVFEPSPAWCGGALPAQLPAFLRLHGHKSGQYPPVAGPPDQGWCAYGIYPVDEGETWYLGFAEKYDYRLGGSPAAGDVIANYTEARVLRMVYDLVRQPPGDPPGPAVDPERLYVFGHSMGGGGALALALRYPNVFAAAYASQPVTDYAGLGGTWLGGQMQLRWGSLAADLPVDITAPHGWAAGLAAHDGTGVWQWQDHRANMANPPAGEVVPFGVIHGRLDSILPWPTQGKPAYTAFNDSRSAWGGVVTNTDHADFTLQGLPGLPPTLNAPGGFPFAHFQVIRDESVPGLSNDTGSLPLPPPDGGLPGGYNQALSWSSSWYPWDGPPIDVPSEWRISLRATDGISHTVDVAPRRLQSFRITPSAAYRWENRRVAGNGLVASGTVTAASDGSITVPGFLVTPGGNRLVLGVKATYLPLLAGQGSGPAFR